MKHIVALSGGKDSTALALALQRWEPRPYLFVCTPTGDELPDMVAHWDRLETVLGSPIIKVRADLDLNGLIDDFDALPNWRQRWCTRMLKIEPYQKWLTDNSPAISYVGLRADEETREGAVFGDMPLVSQRFPLREWGWTIDDVWLFLDINGICVPARTDCARCYGQRLHEWRDLYLAHPDIYAHAEGQEAATGHTFRSPGRDTWPASLAELRAEFARGRTVRRRKRDTECRVCSL